MNAIIAHPDFALALASGEGVAAASPGASAGASLSGSALFSPSRQTEFLVSLQLNGNVRLACKAARGFSADGVSPVVSFAFGRGRAGVCRSGGSSSRLARSRARR